MENIWTVYQSTLESKNEYLGIYLNELDEHAGSDKKGSDWVVQRISSALGKSQTSNEGLIVLNCYLRQASLDVLEQKTSLWTNLVLKVLHSKKDDIDYNLVYTNLSLLASNSTRSSDLSKSFASNHLSKIYESLSSVVPRGYLAALKCTEVCLRLYPGPSGPSRNGVEKFIIKLTDTVNTDINIWNSKCLHLLQQVRGGGTHGVGHKTSWLNYQDRLLGSLHQVLDLAFTHCNELYRTDNEEKVDYGFPELQVSDEPTKRAAQIFVRLHNLVNYLITALRDPFPVAKTVKPKKILNFICRGLSVTCPILEKNPISDNLALGVLLPKIHKIILELLKTLIITLKTNLRPHHLTILGLLVDTLNWTKYRKCIGFKNPLRNLRSKAYEIIAIWCTTLQNGSRIELFADTLLEQVFVDISPYHNECKLKILNGSKKHMSKKARRQLLKAQNEQTNLSQSHSNDSPRTEDFSDGKNYGLCVCALKSLQQLLSSAANFLKPTLIRMIHIKVIQICAVFYELPMDPKQLYYNWECRLEIYNVVHLLITHPNHLCPPPTQMILHILKTARVSDTNRNVQQQCVQILWYLENVIHPRKEGLLFPVDIRDIRNNFIKFGKERLLSSGIFGVNNGTENGYINENDDHEVEVEQLECSEKTGTQECVQLTVVESTSNSVDIVSSREKLFKGLDAESKDSSEALVILSPCEDNTHSEKQEDEKHFDVSLEPKTKRQRLESQHVTVDEECIVLNNKSINGVDGTYSNMDGQASEHGTNVDTVIDTHDNLDLVINGSDIMVENEVAKEAEIDATQLEKNMSNDDDIYADIEAAFVDELNN